MAGEAASCPDLGLPFNVLNLRIGDPAQIAALSPTDRLPAKTDAQHLVSAVTELLARTEAPLVAADVCTVNLRAHVAALTATLDAAIAAAGTDLYARTTADAAFRSGLESKNGGIAFVYGFYTAMVDRTSERGVRADTLCKSKGLNRIARDNPAEVFLGANRADLADHFGRLPATRGNVARGTLPRGSSYGCTNEAVF